MLDWLKKLSQGKSFENKVGLEGKALSLLAEDLEALKKVEEDLPTDSLRYILDGVGEDVVNRLAGTQGAAAALGLIGPLSGPGSLNRSASRPRQKFFECVQCSRPEFFVRLGKIYEAALR